MKQLLFGLLSLFLACSAANAEQRFWHSMCEYDYEEGWDRVRSSIEVVFQEDSYIGLVLEYGETINDFEETIDPQEVKVQDVSSGQETTYSFRRATSERAGGTTHIAQLRTYDDLEEQVWYKGVVHQAENFGDDEANIVGTNIDYDAENATLSFDYHYDAFSEAPSSPTSFSIRVRTYSAIIPSIGPQWLENVPAIDVDTDRSLKTSSHEDGPISVRGFDDFSTSVPPSWAVDKITLEIAVWDLSGLVAADVVTLWIDPQYQ